MSGVCGVLDTHTPLRGAEWFRSLSRRLDMQGEGIRDGHGGALAAQPVHRTANTSHESDVLAAIEGTVRWSDPRWAQTASERGHAAAFAQAYRERGAEALRSMEGVFSAALIDAASRVALIAVDRLGINPLCYAEQDGAFLFATRADALARHPALRRAVSPQAIYDYLFSHMVPSPGSAFEGVYKLLPGEYALWRDGTLTRAFYWRMPYEEPAAADYSSLKNEFRSLLRESVARNADHEATGAFLSGGTDSSTVAGLLREHCGAPVDTYSIGFDAQGFDETEYARIAAQHFDTRAHEYYVTPDDVVRAIPLIAAAYDEPFGNASAVPTYYCARFASEDGIQVMLAGDGGDELFGGNARYAKQGIFEAYSRVPGPLRSALIEPLLFGLPGADKIAPVRKLQRYVEQARVPLPDRLESYNFMLRNPAQEIFADGFLERIDTLAPLATLREVYSRTSSPSALNRMLHLDLKQTLADNDLRKVNRMCELAGVRVRYPLLDESLANFSSRLPLNYKVNGKQLRWFFKEALRDFLPPQIITKSKHGFGLPFGLWLTQHQPLQELAYDSLQSFRARGYLKNSYLDWLLEQHRGSHATYYGVMVWVIMMLEQWLSAHEL